MAGIQRINGSRGHWYKIDGQKADGVTTLIKDGLPKPALMYWAAKSVAEYVADADEQTIATLRDLGRNGMVSALKGVPWGKRDAAAAKGTEVHGLAERLVHGEEIEVPEHLAGYVESCVTFLDDWQIKPVIVEATVGHRRWRYAGTLDLIADSINPDTGHTVRALFDYKTGASGIWPDVALQFAAYRHAEVYVNTDGAEQPMADVGITDSYAVWLRADGYDVYPVASDDAVFKAFLHVAWVARKTNSKTGDITTWLGEAIQRKEPVR